MNREPVKYSQLDSRWAGLDYSAKGEKTTIGASGCGPTAMAMVLATWADPSVTPASECVWALAHGYKCPKHGTYYGYFKPAAARFGLTCRQLNSVSLYGNSASSCHSQVLRALAAGDLVIACMGPGNWTRSGHFVLLWDVDERQDIAYVNDPASTLTRRTRGSWRLFKSQVKFYFIITKPAKTPEKEDEMSEEKLRQVVREELAKVLPGLLKEAVADGLADQKNEVAMAGEPAWSQAEGGWEKACGLGIFDGTRPRAALTRAEMAAVLLRLGLLRKTSTGGG